MCLPTTPKRKSPGTVARLSLDSIVADSACSTGNEAEQEGCAATEASTGPHVKGQKTKPGIGPDIDTWYDGSCNGSNWFRICLLQREVKASTLETMCDCHGQRASLVLGWLRDE